MPQTVSEKHKKPIENAFDLAGRGLKWGVGLLTAGSFVWGVAAGIKYLGTPVDCALSKEVLSCVYNCTMLGLFTLGVIGGKAIIKAQKALEGVTVGSKGKVESVWSRVGRDVSHARNKVCASAVVLGGGVGVGGTSWMVHGHVAGTTALVLMGGAALAVKSFYDGKEIYNTLQSFKKKAPATGPAP